MCIGEDGRKGETERESIGEQGDSGKEKGEEEGREMVMNGKEKRKLGGRI